MTDDTDTRPAQIITADTPFWELPGFDHMAPESEDDA